ncbi:MAG: hypothetical protein ACMG6E_06355 [Candidatus Roizmanbacteria bacterium]
MYKYEGDLQACFHSFLVSTGPAGYFDNKVCIDKYDESNGVIY